MKYDHIGIPTTTDKKWSAYLEGAKVHITDANSDPYKIEWLKFEPGSPMPEVIQNVAHVAFQVDDIGAAIHGKTVIVEPFSPMEGVRCAFIEHDGTSIELIQKG